MNAWSEYCGAAVIADRYTKTMTTAAAIKEFADIAESFRHTQMLRIRIPPANTERRSNGAIGRTWPTRFVLEAATRPMKRKALRGLIIRLPGSNPARARRGFCFFVDGIPPPLPVTRQGTTVTRKSPHVT